MPAAFSLSWSTFFPALAKSTTASSDEGFRQILNSRDSPISIETFLNLTIQNTELSKSASAEVLDAARRGATMRNRVVTPLSRSIAGAGGKVTPQMVANYATQHLNVTADADVLPHILDTLVQGFKSTPPLEEKLQSLIDSIAADDLDSKTRIYDQLRDAGDTFLVISKVPTKELYNRFIKMGWTPKDADKISFSIYKKKRPHLPVVVVTKTKMEVANGAVDDQDPVIDISGCGLEKSDVERFATKLASAPLAVTSLDASANTFHRGGADSIIKMCTAAKNLRELSIAGNNIQAPGVVAVVRAVAQSNSELVRLDISNNFLTTEGAQQEGLVDAVKATNPHLCWLGLAGNELCQGPGGEIVSGLIELGKFKTIVLNCNKLGNGGIAKMVSAIKRDRVLQHLFLDANDLRDDDVAALSEALHNHPTITSISLKRNPLISALGFTALSKLVKVNPGLVQIVYDDDDDALNAVSQTTMVQSLDSNKKAMVSIHHKMVAEGGRGVATDGVCLWMRMCFGNAALVEHFRNATIVGVVNADGENQASTVTGESVWGVSGASLQQNSKLSERFIQKEYFPMMEMLVASS